jgi:prolyl oligopeptidase PreP (S9A serine peptidase family)
LRLATYAKTLPSVIAYNYLAVKGLSDRQIEEFSKKRLAITSLWYDKFTKNKLSLIEVKKILKSLQQHANSLALSWSSHTEYEVCDLKIQTDKLFAKVEKMLASSQLDPTVPEELSPEVKEIIAKSIDLTKDPLYATSLQQVCCLLSMVSNLYTFIAKLESRQVLQQTPLFQLAVVYNNGKQDFK